MSHLRTQHTDPARPSALIIGPLSLPFIQYDALFFNTLIGGNETLVAVPGVFLLSYLHWKVSEEKLK